MFILKKMLLVLLTAFFLMGLSACPEDEGPAEEMGEQIDEGLEDTGDEIEDAGEDIEDAADQ